MVLVFCSLHSNLVNWSQLSLFEPVELVWLTMLSPSVQPFNSDAIGIVTVGKVRLGTLL
jgi:hypothetical protein